MTAVYQDLYIDQNCDWSITIIANNPDGTSMNLSNSVFAGQIKMSQYANTALVNANLNCTVTNAISGQLYIGLDAANTANLQAGEYFYDVLTVSNTTGSNVTTKFMTGLVYVNPTITWENPPVEGTPAL